jgi:IMP dehydrogenase/GMP reductase
VCTTRKKTGVGYPQLSAVLECANAASAYCFSPIFRLGSARVLCARPGTRRTWATFSSALFLNAQMPHQLTTGVGYPQLSAVLECANASPAYYFLIIFRLGSARVLCAQPGRRRAWATLSSALSLNAQMPHTASGVTLSGKEANEIEY